MARPPLMGAGALVRCRRSVLIQQRAQDEHEPLSWCIFGGMAERWESPLECMIREVAEEGGIDLTGAPVSFTDVFVDPHDGFSFHTFVVDVPEMVEPTLSAESIGSQWIELGHSPSTLWDNLPRDLQSGFALFTRKDHVIARMLETTPP